MLELRQITKAYRTASLTQTALDSVSVAFRDNEFVAILGQSGSGKTTLLNVVGGLDHFDSGDLVIDGTSTKDYRDRDWDAYRNHRIGFVFQAYNLIAHQSVVENVELALTLSGVSRAERRQRALAALERVGLAAHVRKRPSQLSGGQMQRVAIARALVNDPEIVLADEPTGALDSATSVQVMDLLRQVADERLVIMVTHNPELAHQYATRIVELADGQIVADSDSYVPGAEVAQAGQAPALVEADAPGTTPELASVLPAGLGGRSQSGGAAGPEAALGSPAGPGVPGQCAPWPALQPAGGGAGEAPARGERRRRSGGGAARTRMGFLTALGLSLGNLLTKKGRTLMTSFAGSIGIIGIAAILALSTGVNAYIARTEEEALTSYPLSIQSSGMELEDPDEGAQVTDAPEGELTTTPSFAAMLRSQKSNDLASLKRFLDSDERIAAHTAAVEYRYRLTPRIYQVPGGPEDPLVQVSPDQALEPLAPAASVGPFSSIVSLDAFRQLPAATDLYEHQFDVVAERWPAGADELVLVLDSHGAMPDAYEYTLGLRDHAELDAIMERYLSGQGTGAEGAGGEQGSSQAGDEQADGEQTGVQVSEPAASPSAQPTDAGQEARTYRYEEVVGRQFSLVPASALYAYDAEHQVWTDRSEQPDVVRQAVQDGDRLTVVGVVRAQDTTTSLSPGLAYTPALTHKVIDQAAASQIVQDQRAHPDTDVFTGRPFAELAAQGGAGASSSLDFTSLFTVDGQALRSAFTIDADRLQAQMAGAAGDLSAGLGSLGNLSDAAGQGASGLAGGALAPGAGTDLSGIDLSGLDLAGAADGALDPDRLAESIDAANLAQLVRTYPELGQMDLVAAVRAALADGVIQDGAGDHLAREVLPGIIAGWPEYYAAHAGQGGGGEPGASDMPTPGGTEGPTPSGTAAPTPLATQEPDGEEDGGQAASGEPADGAATGGTGGEASAGTSGAEGTDSTPTGPDLLGLVRDYLTSQPVRDQLDQALASGRVVDSARLTENLAAALGRDPALQDVAAQVSRDVATQVTTSITDGLVPALSQAVGQAVTTQVSQAMGQALARMTAQIGQAVAAQMQATTTRLAHTLPAAISQAMSVDEGAFAQAFQPAMSQEDLAALMSTLMSTSVPTLEGNLTELGWADTARPSQIDIYPTSFADKDAVKDVLTQYNADARAAGHSERVITYTDIVGTLMSSITRIVDIISWMLIAFVSISLVVSSIMIAIITYISVLERRKEIGILRAIGASKADVRHVFNAETVIEGLLAGLLGVGVTLLLCLPANLVVDRMYDVYPIAQLPVLAGVALVAISVGLTVLAGLIPSAKAAREDPVEALRSE